MGVNESTDESRADSGIEANSAGPTTGSHEPSDKASSTATQSDTENGAPTTTTTPTTAQTLRRTGTKTPLFHAMHAARYQRQAIIRQIQDEITERKLICYVAGSNAQISRDDVLGFNDLLHNIDKGADLDLLLHTPGGDIDAAEKLISMIRTRVGTGYLRVIVADFAKSSGTLIAIGADEILMSDPSELGPIDPQITLNDVRFTGHFRHPFRAKPATAYAGRPPRVPGETGQHFRAKPAG